MEKIKDKKKIVWLFLLFFFILIVVILVTTLNIVQKPQKVEEKTNNSEFLTQINFSNLADETSKNETKEALENAWLSEETIKKFFENVDDFNKTIENKSLVSSFTKVENFPTYDENFIQEKWNSKNPHFWWNNCRITTFSLLKDFIKIKNPSEADTSLLFIDKDSINSKNIFSNEEQKNFESLFSKIKSPNTKDTKELVKTVQDYWNKIWVEFTNTKAKVISVFFQDAIDENDISLFVWHIWVLVPTKDNKFLFIEKLAFQEPYQVLKFDSKGEVSDYLMKKYDVDFSWESARPFVMEDNNLIEWYRFNPETTKKLEKN